MIVITLNVNQSVDLLSFTLPWTALDAEALHALSTDRNYTVLISAFRVFQFHFLLVLLQLKMPYDRKDELDFVW